MSVRDEAIQPPQLGGGAPRSVSTGGTFERVLGSLEARLADDQLWLASICCAAILQLSLIVTHQPWLDEWQALLIARQTPTLASMFAQLHYEGHPQLWYLLLRGLGQVIPSTWILPSASVLLGAASWWAIIAKAPFSRSERLLLLLNELLLFEALAVSRSLTLGVAIFFLALALWRSRWAWLFIALLPLSDFYFGVIACVLIAVRLRDREDGGVPYAGLALFAICGLSAAWAVIPAPDVVTDAARGWVSGSIDFAEQLGKLAVPMQVGGFDHAAPGLGWLFVAPAFLYLCFTCLRGDRLALALLFGFLGFLLLFECVLYPLYLRHIALAAFLLIGLVWIRAERRGTRPAPVFGIWLFAGALCGVATAAVNLSVPFDRAADAASVVKRHKLERKLWFAFPAYWAISVAGQTGIRFGNLDQQCASQFMRWNLRTRITTRSELYAALRTTEERYGSFYFLTPSPVPPPADLGRQFATIPAGYDGLPYNLWKIGSGEVQDSRLPSCVPGLPSWPGVR